MNFAKLHGLGNDFLVIRIDTAGDSAVPLSDLARRACDRHRGVGADGVVFYRPTSGDPDADCSALTYNADGSKAEVSGNGIRCLAAYLHHSGGLVPPTARIRTVAGIRRCVLKDRRGCSYTYESSMGGPVTEPALVPVLLGSGAGPLIQYPLEVGDEVYPVTALSMGNPHCALFRPDVLAVPVDTLGPLLERHDVFPRRTNVEFIQVLDRHNLRVRFWERGVGRTEASGTGSCAAAVAAILCGLAASPVRVHTDGGELQVSWDPPSDVVLTGSAELICEGKLHAVAPENDCR